MLHCEKGAVILDIDLNGLFAHAREPLFVLNERCELVFANSAFNEQLGVTWKEPALRKRLETELLALPHDLPVGQARCVERTWSRHRKSIWWRLLFIPLTGPDGEAVGVLGQIQSMHGPAPAPKAADSLLDERLARLREEQRAIWGFDSFAARSEAMQRLLRQVRMAVATDGPVTFIGESGTGKRTLARLIHHQRLAARGSFAILDCQVLSADAQRRQLLGHFDLPQSSNPSARGLLALPGPGTLVIKSLFSLAHDLQEAILKSLNSRSDDWQLIVTELQPLENGWGDGRLSERFYHLASTFVVNLPPLRDRRSELPDYCAWILDDLRAQGKSSPRSIEPAALELLQDYDWPGNLHELRAVLLAACGQRTDAMITRADLPKRLRRAAPDVDEITFALPKLPSLDEVLETVERRLLALAMQRFSGNKSKASEHLGMSRARFNRRWDQVAKSSKAAE